MITALRHSVTTWCAVAIALAVPTGRVLPLVENILSPIIVDSRVDDVTRDGGRVCFDWHHAKRRAPPQLFFLFWASSPSSPDRSLIAATVVGQGAPRPLRTSLARRAGKDLSVRLCFDLPAYVADDVAATITGYATYEGWGGRFWRMSYTIGPVTTAAPGMDSAFPSVEAPSLGPP